MTALALRLYHLFGYAAEPVVRRVLARRAARGREDPARLSERLGRAGRPRPAGPLVWIHASSVGESLSVLPLIARLRRDRPGLTVLVTTGTVTSARLMAERLPEGALHQYAPVDLPPAVAGFLDHWRPALGLIVESELWPNLLLAARRRGIPLALINARLSGRSARRWRRLRPLAAHLLRQFSLILAQSPEDEARLRALGAPDPRSLGNLKAAAPPLAADAAEVARLRAAIAGRPCWLAASTHPGEEPVVGAAHAALAADRPKLLTLLAPRHPDRGPEIAAALRAAGHRVALRSAGEPLAPETGIYVADTIGELGLWYRLAEIAFMGGSLVPKGGQNPLEPAKLDCAVLYGPHTANFARIAEGLCAAGAAARVSDAASLAAAVAGLLDDPAARAQAIAAGRTFAAAQAGVLDEVVAALAPLLERVSGSSVAPVAREAAR